MHLFKSLVIIKFFVLSVYGQGKIPGVKSIEKCNVYLNVSVFTNIKPLPDEALDLILRVESGYALPDTFIGGYNSRQKRLSFNSRLNEYLNVHVFTVRTPLSDEDLDLIVRVESGYVHPVAVIRGYNSRPNEYLDPNVFKDLKLLPDEYLDFVRRVESGNVPTYEFLGGHNSRPNEYLNANVFKELTPLSDEYLYFVRKVESGNVPTYEFIGSHNSRPNEYLNANVFKDLTPLSDEYLDFVPTVESGNVPTYEFTGGHNSRPKEYLNNAFTDLKPLSDEYLDFVPRVESGNVLTYKHIGGHNSRPKEYLKANVSKNLFPMVNVSKDRFRLPSFRNLVVGGSPSKREQLSFMAVLGYGNNREKQYLCGGSLISPEFVITAAHCLYSRASGPVTYVRLGDLNLTNAEDDEWVQELEVKEFFAHPKFEYPRKYHDIALLKLNKPAVINNNVYPICLEPQRKLIRFSTLYGAGWGALGDGEAPSSNLQAAELFHFLLKDCRQVYNTSLEIPEGIVDSLQICAGGLHRVADTCVGDSGGPLFYVENGVPRILGITSFGKICGTLKIPGVYTRVSNYIEWIESIVWPDNN